MKCYYMFNFTLICCITTGSVILFWRIILQLSKRKIVSQSESFEDQQVTAIRNQVAKMLVANAMLFFLFHMPVSSY